MRISGIFYFSTLVMSLALASQSPKSNSGCNRSIVTYNDKNSVIVRGTHFPMTGFRMFGNYYKSEGRDLAPKPSNGVASLANDLGADLQTPTLENWYAVFACANERDKNCQLKIMPYLRIGSVKPDGTLVLSAAGESGPGDGPRKYAWPSNALSGADCLVVSEKINGRINAFSGRVARIQKNTTSTIILNDLGNIGESDFILPAPPGFSEYRYLGSFYLDTAEVRNIQDSGALVKARMVNLSKVLNGDGDLSKGARVPLQGYICPLATAVVLDSSGVLSTSGGGMLAEDFDADGSRHTLQRRFIQKTTPGSLNYSFADLTIPFSFGQAFYFRTEGNLQATRRGTRLLVTGWIEP